MEEDEGGQKDHLESHLQCSRMAPASSSSSEQTLRWLISGGSTLGDGVEESGAEEKKDKEC